MPQRFDESELLALIEDELDPADAQRVRQRLAAEPRLLALVERMREDRALLRTAPPPSVPAGLLAELEPILARPMLMPDVPARRRRQRRLLPAAAAGVALVVLGGAWALLVARFVPASTAPEVVADAADAPAARSTLPSVPEIASALVAKAPPEPWPPPGTEVHHHGPLVSASARPPAAGGGDGALVVARGGPPPVVAADFMLVLRARDAEQAQEALQRTVSDLGADAALVRNFTYEEADALETARRLADGAWRDGPAERDDVVAEGPGGLASRRQPPRSAPGRGWPRPRAQDSPEARYTTSALLVGSRDLAPSFEQQLDFSQRGADYTLSVSAARLMQVLARLELDGGQPTALRVAAGGDDAGATDELRWLRDWPLARQAAAVLDTHGRDAVIHLPVVVEEP